MTEEIFEVLNGQVFGIGGKFEEGESADECLLREVFEETSIKLTEFKARGIIHFKSNVLPDEDMYLYTASEWENEESTFICPEGELKWILKENVLSLNLWEGDKFFLEPLINGEDNIEITCIYEGDKLIEVR